MNRIIGTLVFLLGLSATLCTAGPFWNVSNAPFASRTNGPQGAIIIADDGVGTAAARTTAVATQHGPDMLRHPAATIRRLQQYGLVGARTQARLPRLAVHTCGGRLVQPDLVRAMAEGNLGSPTNEITFQFEGWSSADRATLQAYLAVAYPKAKLIYGPPALDITVKIIKDDTIQDIQGGIYDASTNEIRMPALTGNLPEDTFILLVLVLRAFHDDVALFYDAWEDGFVGAAATAIQVQPGVSPDFDPKDPGPFYALSVYEAENHPELGGPTFYPEGDFLGMLVWRIAMARAAWLKCWIEDEGFFAKFNERYYAQFREGLQGDVPSLREIAAAATPMVEGLPFQEWFERQYVLDTSIQAGLKEYTWNIPLRNAVALITEHYLTDGDGAEFARGGQARTIYWNYDFSLNLYAEEGNLIDIPTTGDTPGEGFLIPTFFNVGGPQRITVQLDINGLRGYYPYPYDVRGFDPGENNLYGGILNTATGTITVEGGTGISDLAVRRGVWGGRITQGDLAPLKLTVRFVNSEGQEISRQVNVGWDSYVVFLDGGLQATLTHTFPLGATGLQMMSLPVTPLVGSAPEALGIPPEDFLLARWNPAIPPDGKYQTWPDCEPFALGRAYWLRVLRDVTATITGVKAPDDQRVTVPLQLGWNMVGTPRINPVPLSDIKVQLGTEAPVTLAEAADKRLIQAGILAYDETTGYSVVEDALQPFGGYWMRALAPAGCQLVFEPVSTATARVGAAQAIPRPAWRLPLVVEAGWVRSAAAYLGGAPDGTASVDGRYDIEAPPSFGAPVTVRFVQGSGANERQYISDVRGTDPRGETWEVQVSSTLANQPVRISWPDLSRVPQDVRPVLVDPVTGKRLYMRTTPGYTIAGGPHGVQRRLRIEVNAQQQGGLMVTAMSVVPERGGVSLVYTLSKDATVKARVLNIAGRAVRELFSNQSRPAGTNTTAWNLRDWRGSQVPSGMYLFEIEARSEDGQVMRAVRPARVQRP